MAENKIVIDKQEFPLNYKLLRIIARMLPPEAHYAPLARAILTLNVPSITSELVSNSILEPSDLDAIWSTGDIELRRALADEKAFRQHLTDAQADEIMQTNDRDMLLPLAANSDEIGMDDKKKSVRISKDKAKGLMEFLKGHTDERVRKLFVENENLDHEWISPVSEMLENGFVPTPEQIATLTEKDLDLLAGSSREVLLNVADFVEEIKDKKARDKIAKMLMEHPDPEMRIALAENWKAPKAILKALARDEDEDISSLAREKL